MISIKSAQANAYKMEITEIEPFFISYILRIKFCELHYFSLACWSLSNNMSRAGLSYLCSRRVCNHERKQIKWSHLPFKKTIISKIHRFPPIQITQQINNENEKGKPEKWLPGILDYHTIHKKGTGMNDLRKEKKILNA